MNCLFIPFKRSLIVTAASAALFACADTDAGASHESPAPGETEVAALPAEALVATVVLSKTHSVTFYDIGRGGGIYNEVYNMDSDVSATEEFGSDEQLATVYAKLTGTNADPAVLARLTDMDEDRAANAAASPADEPGESEVAGDYRFEERDSDKSWSSDLQYFSSNYCNGCLGQEGSRRGWEPASYPTCTNAPEVCEAGYQEVSYAKTARNFSAFAFNVATSGNGVFTSYLRDPCEHDSWWSRKFNACTKGAQLAYVQMNPRTVVRSTTTAGDSWQYGMKATGPGNVAISLNFY